MPRPRPYDDDPPPQGSPRLMGDRFDSIRGYKATVEFRASGSPLGQSHLFARNVLMAALVYRVGYTQREVASIFALSEARVSEILSELESLLPPRETAE
jgi:hypothetical protein